MRLLPRSATTIRFEPGSTEIEAGETSGVSMPAIGNGVSAFREAADAQLAVEHVHILADRQLRRVAEISLVEQRCALAVEAALAGQVRQTWFSFRSST